MAVTVRRLRKNIDKPIPSSFTRQRAGVRYSRQARAEVERRKQEQVEQEKPEQEVVKETYYDFGEAFAARMPFIQREFEKGFLRQEGKKIEEKARRAKWEGYNTIVEYDPEEKVAKSVTYTVPEKKAKQYQKEAEETVGKQLREERPIYTEANLLWNNPIGFFRSKGIERDREVARLAVKQEARQDKYGVVGGSLITAASSPAFTTTAAYGLGAGFGVAKGSLYVGSLTGSKAAGAASLVTSGVAAAAGGAGTGLTAKQLTRDDLTKYEKGTIALQFGAGVVAGASGYRTGFKSVVDPYFQVKSITKGEKEQGLVYDKKGSGSITQSRKVTYETFKGKQFEADITQQQTFKTTPINKQFTLKTGKTVVETDLVGKNLVKGTEAKTSLAGQTYKDVGLVYIERQAQAGQFQLTGGKSAGLTSDNKIYYSEFTTVSGKGGKGVSITDSYTADVKTGQYTKDIGDVTKFRPIKQPTSIWQSKRGSLTITGQGQTVRPTFIEFGSPKVTSIPFFTTSLTSNTGSGLMVGSASGLGVGAGTNIVTASSRKVSRRETPKVIPILAGGRVTTKQKQRVVTAPDVTTSGRTATGGRVTIPRTPSIVTPEPTTPYVPPAIPLLFGLPGSASLTGKRKKKEPKKSRGFGYTPSLSSALLGITSSKKPLKRVYTGFEQRPIIISKKKRKRMLL